LSSAMQFSLVPKTSLSEVCVQKAPCAVVTTCRSTRGTAGSSAEKGGTMDPRAFDELSKRLAEKTSRGRALKVFGGALVGGLFGAREAHANPPQKHCKFQGYNCGDNTECCSLNCCNRTCCGNGQTCCGGQCVQCPSGQVLNTNTCLCEGGTSPPPPPPGGCQSNGDCPPAPAGTCQAAACVSGTCTTVPDNMNLPSCGVCQTATCTGGVPACVNSPTGTACPMGVCNGAGSCVQCLSPTDCPGANTECTQKTCLQGMCGTFNEPNGFPCGMGGVCINGICSFP